MNVIVCVKQIPDPAQVGELDPSDNTLKRDGKLILDESDSYGVEMALQLVGDRRRRRGQPGVDGAQRRGVRAAHGAGDGCGEGRAGLRPELAGSDALTTAKVLAAARKRLGDADLIIAGTESSDGYTGTVPEQLAEVLGLPSVTFAKHVEVDGDDAQGQPPDRGRLRRGDLPDARRRQRHRRRRRAALPELQGDHGRQVEAGRDRDGGRPRRLRRSAGPEPARRSSTSPRAPEREAGEVVEDDGEGYAKIVEFLDKLKVI